jgi:hypothetical protein
MLILSAHGQHSTSISLAIHKIQHIFLHTKHRSKKSYPSIFFQINDETSTNTNETRTQSLLQGKRKINQNNANKVKIAKIIRK